MPEPCLISWQSVAYEWGIWDLWHQSDLAERAILIVLALMLAYTVFVVIRFSRRYILARRESRAEVPDSWRAYRQRQRILVADLSRGLMTLKAISSAAPFLELAGTSYGIMAWFYRASVVHNYVAYLLSVGTATMLKTAVAGILAAIPALLAHNLLRTLIDRFERESLCMLPAGISSEEGPRPFRRAQSLPLKKRFLGPPPFAPIAVFVLATLLFIYMLLTPYVSKGLRIRLLPIGSVESHPSYEQMVVISVVDAGPNDPAQIRMDSRQIPRKDLRKYLLQKLNPLPKRTVYVQAESAVSWGYITDVIDVVKTLNADVVLLTTIPARDPKCGGSKSRGDSHCRP